MGEQDSISGVWREALAIIRRYPAAVVVPGAVLGALAEAPTYLIVDRLVLDQLLTYLAAAFAYYLYLAYAEGLTTDYERGEDLTASRSRLARLLEAASFVPRVLVAALVSGSLASAATALLVVPGTWLYTRWSLSSCSGVGPLLTLSQSSATKSFLSATTRSDPPPHDTMSLVAGRLLAMRASSPSPPLRVFLKVSGKSPVTTQSGPSPPTTRSPPSSPLTVSLPSSPNTLSEPWSPKT